jgi:hypothetical protein
MDQSDDDDPVYTTSLREAKVLLVVWLLTALWSVSYCVVFGYTSDGRLPVEFESWRLREDPLGWGFPSWAFWGILVPWGASIVFSIFFALVWMKDHPTPGEREVGS